MSWSFRHRCLRLPRLRWVADKGEDLYADADITSLQLWASIEDYGPVQYKIKDFTADAFADVYSENMRVLNHLKATVLDKYHKMMHKFLVDLRCVAVDLCSALLVPRHSLRLSSL